MKIRLQKFWLPLWVVLFYFFFQLPKAHKAVTQVQWEERVTLPQLIRSSSELWESSISPEAPRR